MRLAAFIALPIAALAQSVQFLSPPVSNPSTNPWFWRQGPSLSCSWCSGEPQYISTDKFLLSLTGSGVNYPFTSLVQCLPTVPSNVLVYTPPSFNPTYPSAVNAALNDLSSVGNAVAAVVAPSSLGLQFSEYSTHCYFNASATNNPFAPTASGQFSLVAPAPTVVLSLPAAGTTWQVGDVITVAVAPISGWQASQCIIVALDWMAVNTDDSLTETFHSWSELSTSTSQAQALSVEIPAFLQNVLSATPSRYVIRARCSADGTSFNPVGNVSSVFSLARRDLSTSFITAKLGAASNPAAYSYGADIPLSLAISRVQSSKLQAVKLGFIAQGTSGTSLVSITGNASIALESLHAFRVSSRDFLDNTAIWTTRVSSYGDATNWNNITTVDDLVNSFPSGVSLTLTATAPDPLAYISSLSAVTLTRPAFQVVTDSLITAPGVDGPVKPVFIGGVPANVSWSLVLYGLNAQQPPPSGSVPLQLRLRNFTNGAAAAQAAAAGQTDPSTWLNLPSPGFTSIGNNGSATVPITDAMAANAGFNQLTVCADGSPSGDPTLPSANCNYDTVVYIGAPAAQLNVYGPYEQNGPLFPHLFLAAGEPVTFTWAASTTATSFTLGMWAAAAGASAADLRSATLVTSVAVAVAPSQSSLSWTIPSNLIYDPTMQYFFTLKPLVATPAAVATIAPLAGLTAPAVPAATLGGVFAQTAWGYTIAPASATITLVNPTPGAAYYLDQWTPIAWTTTGLATTQQLFVELWYPQGRGDAQSDYESWQWYASAQATVGSGVAGWLQLGESTFFNGSLPSSVNSWPWSSCDPTAPIPTMLHVWTTLPNSSVVVEAWSKEFSVYKGTGARGLSVSVSGNPTSLTPGSTYFLNVDVVNPGAANPQALPTFVAVSVHRFGRMFGGAKFLANLGSLLPLVQSGPSTWQVNVTLPQNLTIDYVHNDVTFLVVDSTPAVLTPWGGNATIGTWGRTPYLPLAPSSCPSFQGFRATLRAHCNANDVPGQWRALCATNCSQCSAAGGFWAVGAQASYDFVLPQSTLTDYPVDAALAREALGAFFAQSLSLCIPAVAGDALDVDGVNAPRDAALAAQIGVRRYSWGSGVVNSRASTLSGGLFGGVVTQLTVWGGHPISPAACTGCSNLDELPRAAQVDLTISFAGVNGWSTAGVAQMPFAAAALVSAANRALNTASGNRGYLYLPSNATVTAWTLPTFSGYDITPRFRRQLEGGRGAASSPPSSAPFDIGVLRSMAAMRAPADSTRRSLQAQNAGAAIWAYPGGAGPALSSGVSVNRLTTYISAVLTAETCPVGNSVTAAPLVNAPPLLTPQQQAVPHQLRLSFYGSPADLATFTAWVGTLSSTPAAFASIGATITVVSSLNTLDASSLSTANDAATSGPLSAYIYAATSSLTATQLANYAVAAGGFDVQPLWGPPGTAAILASGLLSTGGPQNYPGTTTAPPPPIPTVHSSGVNVGAAVGGTIGGLAGLVAVIGLAWFVSNKRGGGGGGGGAMGQLPQVSPNPMGAAASV